MLFPAAFIVLFLSVYGGEIRVENCPKACACSEHLWRCTGISWPLDGYPDAVVPSVKILDLTGSLVNVLPNWRPTRNFPNLKVIFLTNTMFDGGPRCRELECLEELKVRVVSKCPSESRHGCRHPPCCHWNAEVPRFDPVSIYTPPSTGTTRSVSVSHDKALVTPPHPFLVDTGKRTIAMETLSPAAHTNSENNIRGKNVDVFIMDNARAAQATVSFPYSGHSTIELSSSSLPKFRNQSHSSDAVSPTSFSSFTEKQVMEHNTSRSSFPSVNITAASESGTFVPPTVVTATPPSAHVTVASTSDYAVRRESTTLHFPESESVARVTEIVTASQAALLSATKSNAYISRKNYLASPDPTVSASFSGKEYVYYEDIAQKIFPRVYATLMTVPPRRTTQRMGASSYASRSSTHSKVLSGVTNLSTAVGTTTPMVRMSSSFIKTVSDGVPNLLSSNTSIISTGINASAVVQIAATTYASAPPRDENLTFAETSTTPDSNSSSDFNITPATSTLGFALTTRFITEPLNNYLSTPANRYFTTTTDPLKSASTTQTNQLFSSMGTSSVFCLPCPSCVVGSEVRMGLALDGPSVAGIVVGTLLLAILAFFAFLWKRRSGQMSARRPGTAAAAQNDDGEDNVRRLEGGNPAEGSAASSSSSSGSERGNHSVGIFGRLSNRLRQRESRPPPLPVPFHHLSFENQNVDLSGAASLSGEPHSHRFRITTPRLPPVSSEKEDTALYHVPLDGPTLTTETRKIDPQRRTSSAVTVVSTRNPFGLYGKPRVTPNRLDFESSTPGGSASTSHGVTGTEHNTGSPTYAVPHAHTTLTPSGGSGEKNRLGMVFSGTDQQDKRSDDLQTPSGALTSGGANRGNLLAGNMPAVSNPAEAEKERQGGRTRGAGGRFIRRNDQGGEKMHQTEATDPLQQRSILTAEMPPKD